MAFEHGFLPDLYRKICRPNGEEWAAYLRCRAVLHSMGNDCFIQTNVTFTDPKYVRIGNNVRMSGCTLFGHDGSVNMINRAFGLSLDRVGKIDIRDNVFIGHGAIILPDVTIGPNAVVAAGSVVSRDVPPNSVVAGNPAKQVGTLTQSVEKLSKRNENWPWLSIVRDSAAPERQAEIDALREAYFFRPETND